MAKLTIAELKDQIQCLRNTIELQAQEIIRLNKQNNDIMNRCEVVSRQEFETLLKEFEYLKFQYKLVTEENKRLKEKLEMKMNTTYEEPHNSRGAGRKSNINNDILNMISKLHQENKSLSEIASAVGLSKSYIHKLISGQNAADSDSKKNLYKSLEASNH